jgi:hypothetical protein
LFNDAVPPSAVSSFGIIRMPFLYTEGTAFCACVLGRGDCEQTAAVLITWVGLLSHTEEGKKIHFLKLTALYIKN